MKTILVTLPLEQRHKEQLLAAGRDCNFVFTDGRVPEEAEIAQAEVIIGIPPAERIKASPRLELLQLSSAGADPYVKPGVLSARTVLTNATGAYGKAVSEHALAMTLMLQKKLHLYRDDQRRSTWSDEGTVVSIADSTVLILGLGDIGLRYGRMAKALGATVIGVRRRPGVCPEGVDELITPDQTDACLGRADVVASFMPSTPATIHYFTEERFHAMKPGAVFINCGRGNAVAPEVLDRALREGWIAAAGIDVAEVEPLPADSPLWLNEKLLLTPHVSGFFHLPETLDRIIDIAAENLSAFLAGQALKNIVDFETGYRK